MIKPTETHSFVGNNILGLAMNNILLKESKLIINPLLRNVVKWSDTH